MLNATFARIAAIVWSVIELTGRSLVGSVR